MLWNDHRLFIPTVETYKFLGLFTNIAKVILFSHTSLAQYLDH